MHWNTRPLHRQSPLPGDYSKPLGRGTVASLLAVATLTALCYPLLSVGLARAPPFQFAALRAGVAGLSLLMLALVLRRPFPQTRRLWLLAGGSGFSATTMGFASVFGAGGLIAPGIAAVVAGTQPIVAGLLALVMFGQPIGKWQAIGMSVALAGLTAMTLQDISAGGTTAVAGIAPIVSATGGSAFGNALTKRFASDVDPIAAAAVQLLLGSVPLAILAFVSEPFTSVVLEPRFLALVIVLGIGGTAVTFTLWIAVFNDCPLNTANAFNFLVPLLGVAISVAFLGESLTPLAMAGMVLTIIGVVLAVLGG
ncbi:DMT family transporter [Cypionkella psychrotolerans]|uniref:DMT family transporter n=1 Tax=Cypionkella psychrotolerans TaxID=1678131 RepID=UPI0009E91B37|nr:DMT family transporter [Cypionkella psychrotolerans]